METYPGRGHNNIFLTPVTVFHQNEMDVKLPILHHSTFVMVLMFPSIFSHYLVPILQEFSENTHINWNGTTKCVKNQHYRQNFLK